MHDRGDDLSDTTGVPVRMVVRRASPVAWTLCALTVMGAAVMGSLLSQSLKDAREETGRAREATNQVATNLHESESARHALESDVAKLGPAEAEPGTPTSLPFVALQERLQAEIKKGDAHLSEVNGRVRLELVDSILFEPGQVALSARGSEVLGRVGSVLAGAEDRPIQVSGHSDDGAMPDRLQSSFPSAWELSAAQAVHVVRFLAEHARVPPRRLAASGYGAFQPVASNGTATGRARNRRIEILLLPSDASRAGSVVAQAEPPMPESTAAGRKDALNARRHGGFKLASANVKRSRAR